MYATARDPLTDRLLTDDEACHQLGCSRATLYRMTKAGTFSKVNLSARMARWSQREVQTFIDSKLVGQRS